MKRVLLVFFLLIFIFFNKGFGQDVSIDFSGKADTTVTINSNRNSPDCNGATSNCIVFTIKLNANADLLNFEIKNPAPPGNAAFYTLNCDGIQRSLGTPICITGNSTVTITYCKTGNDHPDYIFTSSTAVKASADLNLRQLCTGTMSVTGLQPATVTWTSIFPGTPGQYDSYLSSPTGSLTTNVTPAVGAPATILYKVSGNTNCTLNRSDTVRVNTYAPLTVALTPTSPVICATGGSITLTATPTGGNAPYTYLWSNGATTPSITVSTAATYTVNVSDNTIGCGPIPQSVTVTAAPTPAAPTAAGATICSGSTATVTATAPGGTYQWYNAASGGTPLFTGTSFTTPVLSTTTTYYVDVTSAAGCTSSRTAVIVTVNPIPVTPTAAPASTCNGSSATLSASSPSGGTYDWFSTSSGGTSLFTGATFTTPVLTANTTYYVQTTVNGCVSARVAVNVTVNPTPVAPTANGTTICNGTAASLLATAPGGNYEWYDAAVGGNLLITGSAFTTPILTTTTTYYVQTTINGCTGPRTAVTVTVAPIPTPPTAAGATICSGSTTTLTATAPGGGTFAWYSSASGGTLLGTGANFTTPVLTGNAIYYVETNVSGCVSARTAVTVTVNPLPAAPTVSGTTTVCLGTGTVLTATAPGGTYRWYSVASGGTLLFTGDTYTTPNLTTTTTYYVDATSASGCTGPRRAVTVTVTPPVNPAFTYSSGTFCITGTNPTPTFVAPSGGTFSSTPGLVINAATGEINLAASTLGTYIITFVTNTSCAFSSSQSVTITNSPDATFSYAGPYCQFQTNPLPTFAAGASAGIFSSTAGLVFLNASTGEIDLQNSVPGTYTVTNTIAASGGCAPDIKTNTVTINATPTVNSAATGLVCSNTAQNYTITSNIPGTTFSWSRPAVTGISNASVTGQTSIIINETLINTTNAPIDVIYTIVPSNGCTGPSFSYTVTVNPTPAVTSAASVTICNNAAPNYTIQSNISGTTFSWSRAFVAGITNSAVLGQTGNTINETLVNTTNAAINVEYIIVPSANGCDGTPFTYTVTVNPTATVISATTAVACSNTAQNYSIQSNVSGATFSWGRAAVAGISNSAITGQTSSTITETLINTTNVPINVVYTIVPSINGCDGTPFTYTVTVNPTPAIISAASAIICSNTAQNYTIQSNTSGATFSWSRTSVSGINNSAVTGQSNTITETLINTTSAPINVVYTIVPSANGCDGTPFTYTVTVSPTPTINSASTQVICNNTAQSYTITSSVAGTTFSWSRAAVAGISNSTINGQAGSSITETLINTTTNSINVVYNIILTANGCDGPAFTYTVTVNPTPIINSASTMVICNNTAQNYTITSNVSSATFSWSRAFVAGISNGAVNGQTSSTITETLINTTNAPINVVYTIVPSVNGCDGAAFTYTVTVNPTATITNTALSQTVCSQSSSAAVAFTFNIPGTTVQWTTTASSNISGFVASGTGDLLSQTLVNAGSTAGTIDYLITPYLNGCPGTPVHYIITVNPKPATPVLSSNSPVCQNYALTLTTPTIPGATYLWTGPNGFTSAQQNPIINNAQLSAAGQYSLIITVNGCSSDAGTVSVTILPTPSAPVASSNGPLCAGNTLMLSANTIAGATYSWTGPNGFISSLQNPSITNITPADGGVYAVTVTVNGCTSAAGTTTAVVTAVPAAPVVTTNGPVCEGSTINLSVNNIPGTTYSWTGPNGFTSNLPNPTILATSQANAGVYSVTATVNGCTGPSASVTVNVNQTPVNPVASSNSAVCSGSPIILSVTTFAGAIYQWTGPNGFTSNLQNPVINNASTANAGTYTVSITAPGCLVTTSTSTVVVVKQTPVAPTVSSNSPVCTGDNLNLAASNVAGAIYSWVGPNGFTSALRNPVISNASVAASGAYSVTVTVDGCTSAATTTNVVISVPKIAFAGNNQVVCANNPIVTLAGTITNDNTGIWTSSGTGTFSPSNTSLSATYTPSAADIAAGNITLTLSSVNNGGCGVASSSIQVTITPTPIVNSGGNKSICDNDPFANLTGSVTYASGGKWTTSGTGTFSPSANAITANYIPSEADKKIGSVKLTLTSVGNNCLAVSDVMTLTIVPSPTINMPDTKYILQGESAVLSPVVTGSDLQYSWSPASNLSSATIRNPVVTGVTSQLYTLSVTGTGGCIVQKQVMVTVLKPIVIPNTFTPNGDGINDRWVIKELENYPGAQLSLFNRYGTILYHTKGDYVPWDGNYNGQPVPFGTYYYLIDLGKYGQRLSGYIVVLR